MHNVKPTLCNLPYDPSSRNTEESTASLQSPMLKNEEEWEVLDKEQVCRIVPEMLESGTVPKMLRSWSQIDEESTASLQSPMLKNEEEWEVLDKEQVYGTVPKMLEEWHIIDNENLFEKFPEQLDPRLDAVIEEIKEKIDRAVSLKDKYACLASSVNEHILNDARILQIIRNLYSESALTEELQDSRDSLLVNQGIMIVLHQKLTDLLVGINQVTPIKSEHKNSLEMLVQRLIQLDNRLTRHGKLERLMQSSVAVACRYLAAYYRKFDPENTIQANYYLALPCQLNWSLAGHQLGQFDQFRIQTDQIEWKKSGCITTKRIRVCQKVFPPQKIFLFLTCFISTATRKEMQCHWENLDISELTIKNDDHIFYYKTNADGICDFTQKVDLGDAISFERNGIIIKVGNDSKMWNQYHKIQIEIPIDKNPDDFYQMLSSIGLATLAMDSRPQDIMMEKLFQVGSYGSTREFLQLAPSPEMSAQTVLLAIDQDMKQRLLHMQPTAIGSNGQIDFMDPLVIQEFIRAGGVGFGATIGHAGVKNFWDIFCHGIQDGIFNIDPINRAAFVLSLVLKSGLLSTMERFDRGILNAGCCPMENIKTGSANQVFLRPLSTTQFNTEWCWNSYAVPGALFVLFKPELAGRLPYSYPEDQLGINNPDYDEGFMPRCAQREYPKLGLSGRVMNQRMPLDTLVSKQENEGVLVTAECMFEDTVGSQFIAGVIVQTTEDKQAVITTLQSNGISTINGKPLDAVIFVSKTFKADMLPCLERQYQPQ